MIMLTADLRDGDDENEDVSEWPVHGLYIDELCEYEGPYSIPV